MSQRDLFNPRARRYGITILYIVHQKIARSTHVISVSLDEASQCLGVEVPRMDDATIVGFL